MKGNPFFSLNKSRGQPTHNESVASSFYFNEAEPKQKERKKISRFTASKLVSKPLLLGVLGIVVLLFGACQENTTNQLGISSHKATNTNTNTINFNFNSSQKQMKADKAMNNFIAEEPSISNFRQLTSDIHSLKTLAQIKSKQLILVVPEDAAFEKLGKVEKEKLLDKTALNHRHQLFKNSLVLHDKSNGDWEGTGMTYGGSLINLNTQTGTISFDNNEARILKQVVLKGGHLLYIVDKVLG